MLRFFSVFVLIAAVTVFFRRRRFLEVDFFSDDDGEDIWDEFYSDEWPFEWV